MAESSVVIGTYEDGERTFSAPSQPQNPSATLPVGGLVHCKNLIHNQSMRFNRVQDVTVDGLRRPFHG